MPTLHVYLHVNNNAFNLALDAYCMYLYSELPKSFKHETSAGGCTFIVFNCFIITIIINNFKCFSVLAKTCLVQTGCYGPAISYSHLTPMVQCERVDHDMPTCSFLISFRSPPEGTTAVLGELL